MYIYFVKYITFNLISMNINTLYNWPKMKSEEFDYVSSIIRVIIKDYIRLNDWFSQFNELISQEDHIPNKEIYIEGQLNGLLAIFLLGGIENETHRAILEDITYEMVISSRKMNMTIEERTTYILVAWQEKLLNF